MICSNNNAGDGGAWQFYRGKISLAIADHDTIVGCITGEERDGPKGRPGANPLCQRILPPAFHDGAVWRRTAVS